MPDAESQQAARAQAASRRPHHHPAWRWYSPPLATSRGSRPTDGACALNFFPAVIPALWATSLGGLDRLAIDARGTGGGLVSRCAARLFSPDLPYLGTRPISAPLRKVVIDYTLRQPIMRQPIPLTAAPMQGKHSVQDFPQVHGATVASAPIRLGRRDPRFHKGPLSVCEIGFV